MIGSALSALVALSFLALGIGSYAAPTALAENYGLPVSNATEIAYLRALGTRDFALGLLVAGFLPSAGNRDALRSALAVSALVAAGDFAAVFATRGPAAKAALAIHGGGFAGLLIIRELVAREV